MNNDYSNNNYDTSSYTSDYSSSYSSNYYSTNGYGEPVNNSTTFATVSLTIGIMSLLFCGYLILPGIAGVIFAILSIVKKEQAKRRQIGGLVTSIISILFSIFFYVFIAIAAVEFSEEMGSSLGGLDLMEDLEYEFETNYLDEYSEYSWDVEWDMIGYKFQADDESMIHFNYDDSFSWYLDDANHEDNYYRGTYEIYEASDAYYMLTNDLTEYGITQEELDDYFERNADSDIYCMDNLTVLVLETDYMVVDGAESDEYQEVKYYYGFYYDDVFDAVKMDSANEVLFTKMGDSEY